MWHFFKQDKRITIMNIHEYQGKEILASYGVRVQRGIVANNPVEAVAAAKQLTTETGTSWYVVKAQIHAEGWELTGKVKTVLLRGKVAIENNHCNIDKGYGKFIKRNKVSSIV